MARRIADALSEIEKRVDESDELSPEDRVQIKARAREEVKKRRKEAATKRALDEAIREEERSFNPQDQFEDVVIDLAPHIASEKLGTSAISLDGVLFAHGKTYTVTYNVARTLYDIMGRAWEHESEIRTGKSKLAIRPHAPVIRPGTESAVNTRRSVLSPDVSI